MLSFDTEKSLAILVGCNHRNGGEFDSLYPAVKNNLWDLGNLVRSKDIIGIEDTYLIEDRKNNEVLEQIRELCQPGKQLSCLIFYFCGHGLQGDGRNSLFETLHLVTHNTESDRRKWTAISFADVREIIASACPSYAFIFLDCCFSGSALDQGAIKATTGNSNAFVVAACPSNRQTCWPPGKSNTAFTEILLSVLKEGIARDGALPTISISDFFAEVKRRCIKQNYPVPVCQGTVDDHSVEFAKNVAKIEKLTADERKFLKKAGVTTDQLSKLDAAADDDGEGAADDIMQHLNEMVHKRIWERKAPSKVVKEICKLELFREFHRNACLKHDITQQVYEVRLDMNGNAQFLVSTDLTAASPMYSVLRTAYGDAELNDFQHLAAKFTSNPSTETRQIALLDEPTKKEILFFLKPPLPEYEAVSYDVTWKWPRTYRKLFKPPYTDTWAFRVRSATADLSTVISRLYVPGGAGSLRIQNTGAGGGELTVDGREQDDGSRLYEWSIKELKTPARVVLELQLTPSAS